MNETTDPAAPATADTDREITIATWVTRDEWATIETLAEQAGLDISAYLRATALASNDGHIKTITGLWERVARAEQTVAEIASVVQRHTDAPSDEQQAVTR
jgi:hypothetical protein